MTATGYPPPAAARRAMLVLSLVGFFVTTDITLTALLIEPMKHDLALTEIMKGWKVADVIAILGSVDIVLSDVDR